MHTPIHLAFLRSVPGFQDPFSSLTHLGGAGVFAALSFFLIRRGLRAEHGVHRGRVASLAVFACSAVLLLTMSGVFHLLSPGAGRDVLQRLDHAAIFLLIAGTFTPMHTILFRGPWRWGMLAFIWTIAILGVTLKSIFFASLPAWAGTLLYVGMGWVGVLSFATLVRRHRPRGFRFARHLIFGGIAYTIGAALELIDPPPLIMGVVRSHEVFHIAVLAGLGLHWRFIWKIAARAMPQGPPRGANGPIGHGPWGVSNGESGIGGSSAHASPLATRSKSRN